MKHGKTNPRALFLYLLKFWRTLVVVLVPLICLPLLFVDKHDEKVRNGKREIPSLPRYVIVPVSADDDPDSDLIAFRRPRINMQSLNANARPDTERIGSTGLTRR